MQAFEPNDLNFNRSDFDASSSVIYKYIQPTPQISWPLINKRTGCEVWVKHENHNPTGAFKIRGGIWYVENLRQHDPDIGGAIAATRGNHGQSVALACRHQGLQAVVVVPHGNSREKNLAMQAYGAELIEHGRDFNEALDFTHNIAEERSLHLFPPFHPWLVQGVGTYAMELFRQVHDLHTVYVPIGMGSGICGVIAAREALGLTTEIVGVVAKEAAAYSRSFQSGSIETTNSADTFADGLAVRVPDPIALERIRSNVARVVEVSEEALYHAVRAYFVDTHNVAEGAGASTLAALLQEREVMRGKKVGLILSGGNVDQDVYERALKTGEED